MPNPILTRVGRGETPHRHHPRSRGHGSSWLRTISLSAGENFPVTNCRPKRAMPHTHDTSGVAPEATAGSATEGRAAHVAALGPPILDHRWTHRFHRSRRRVDDLRVDQHAAGGRHVRHGADPQARRFRARGQTAVAGVARRRCPVRAHGPSSCCWSCGSGSWPPCRARCSRGGTTCPGQGWPRCAAPRIDAAVDVGVETRRPPGTVPDVTN